MEFLLFSIIDVLTIALQLFVSSDYHTGVFPKWSITFSDFSEFRETDKSLKHELGSV